MVSKNTEDEVVIPRELARRLKALLMNLEDYWNNRKDEDRRDRVKRLSVDLTTAEKYLGKPVTPQDQDELRDLIPN